VHPAPQPVHEQRPVQPAPRPERPEGGRR
jgi:hypothetical protein